MLATSTPVMAGDRSSHEADVVYTVTDVVIVRPVAFLAAVAGAGLYFVTLPVTAITGDSKEVGETLVLRPGRVAFSRRNK